MTNGNANNGGGVKVGTAVAAASMTKTRRDEGAAANKVEKPTLLSLNQIPIHLRFNR